jgi:hypothetical protein
MNERQKQNKNSVQGPHQTASFISKKEPSDQMNAGGSIAKTRNHQTSIVMQQMRLRVAARFAHELEQKIVVAPATAGYTRAILSVV